MNYPARSCNPNKVRALLGAFVHSNPGAFHRADHAGYRFLGEQVASRLITPLTRWRRYEPAYADGMRAVLKELLGHPVDVVTERGLRDRIRERVLRDARPL